MKLLVVSHTPHYLRGGEIVGFGPTVREICHLARLFDSVVHLAPLHAQEAPASALPYGEPAGSRVILRPIAPSGGDGLAAKLGILLRAPSFLRSLRREVAAADVWHLRAPANVALLAMAGFGLLPERPCWIKYAGNWRPQDGRALGGALGEAWSYGWQRRWLARPRANVAVTVNGRWPGDPPHVFPFRNPSFTAAELAAARAEAGSRRSPSRGDRLELLFAGRLDEPKGAGRAIEILARLLAKGIDARLALAGGGADRPAWEQLARQLGCAGNTEFLGELPRPAIEPHYRRAHFLLLPTRSSEGWPKVLSEAMAYGALPLAGAVSSIPQLLAAAGAGRALPPLDLDAFCSAIEGYLADGSLFAAEASRAREAAADFTYDRHLAAVQELFETRWKLQLAP